MGIPAQKLGLIEWILPLNSKVRLTLMIRQQEHRTVEQIPILLRWKK